MADLPGCDVLVRVRDKPKTGNPRIDTKRTMRGDVIMVRQRGMPYSTVELTHPDWRIFSFENIEADEAQMLLSSEPPGDPLNPSLTWQVRLYRLDIDNLTLPKALRDFISDDTRQVPIFAVKLTAAQIRSLFLRKQPVVDPMVL